MKFLTYYQEDILRVGVKTNKGVLALSKATHLSPVALPQTIEEIVPSDEWLNVLAEVTAQALLADDPELFLNEANLQFGPAVPHPSKIICVGLNYRKHAEESNMPIPASPVLFNKFPNSLAAHQDAVTIPSGATQVDYEAELAIVIGKRAKHVSQEEALSCVFGYCTANDISARDLQMRTSQWLLGKCCDGFSPLGPYLVTTDEVDNPNQLWIRTYVNGELRQNSNTSDMIFSCAEIISYISQYMTLEPGDVILTGTPEGVILGYPEEKRVWLQPGDEVVVEIEGLGQLRNTFISEAK